MYGLKLAFKESYGFGFKIVALIASAYAIYTLFATGIEYAFASAIIFALGIPVYLVAKPKMRKYEKAIALVIGLAGILALIMILRGGINF